MQQLTQLECEKSFPPTAIVADRESGFASTPPVAATTQLWHPDPSLDREEFGFRATVSHRQN